jgi:hypothetical protein
MVIIMNLVMASDVEVVLLEGAVLPVSIIL